MGKKFFCLFTSCGWFWYAPQVKSCKMSPTHRLQSAAEMKSDGQAEDAPVALGCVGRTLAAAAHCSTVVVQFVFPGEGGK